MSGMQKTSLRTTSLVQQRYLCLNLSIIIKVAIPCFCALRKNLYALCFNARTLRIRLIHYH